MTALVDAAASPGATRPSVLRARTGRRAWLAAALVVAVIVTCRLVTAPMPTELETAPASAFPSSAAIEARYGVRFVQLDVLAAGGLVELRYLVLDPDLATAFHDPTGAHLPHVVTRSGAELRETPFHSHSTAQAPGATYSILFRNDGGAVVRGDRVAIAVGDLRLTDVAVR